LRLLSSQVPHAQAFVRVVKQQEVVVQSRAWTVTWKYEVV
jgi:hypothetical protein